MMALEGLALALGCRPDCSGRRQEAAAAVMLPAWAVLLSLPVWITRRWLCTARTTYTAAGRLRSGAARPNGAETRRFRGHGCGCARRLAQACPGQALPIRAFLCEPAAGERA